MKLLAGLFVLFIPLAGAAAHFQAIAEIKQAAEAAMPGAGESGVEVSAMVDTALRLPQCQLPLQAHSVTAGTVEVSCADISGWRLFVPVKLRRLQPVVILARAMNAGETLGADALTLETRDISGINGALVDVNTAIGHSLRHAMAAGSVLSSKVLISPRLIRRGDTVTLVVNSGGIEVRALGRALGEAGAGERINVENSGSRRTLQGLVRKNGEVDVTH